MAELTQTQGGILGLVVILASLGGNLLLEQDVFDNSYVCTANEKLGFFMGNVGHPEPLSSTSKSGYWIDVDGNDRRSTCRNGVWQTLSSYAEEKGIDPFTLIVPQPVGEDVTPTPEVPQSKQYLCNDIECVVKGGSN